MRVKDSSPQLTQRAMKEIRDFDVVVVGAGNAALVAALSAAERDVKVAVLEAAPWEERGGNSRFAGAIFRINHDGMEHIKPLLCDSALPATERVNLGPYTREAYTEDLLRVTRGQAKDDLAYFDVLLNHGYDTCKWMKEACGVNWQLTLNKFFNEDKIKSLKAKLDIPPAVGMMSKGQGVGLINCLFDAVAKRQNITVFYDTPAVDLLYEGDIISGVRARQNKSPISFHGQVILAAGGFEANPRLRRQFLGDGWDLVLVRGTRFNTGTMLEKAITAGVQSFGNWGGAHATPQDLDAPRVGDLRVVDHMSRYSYPYGITVNVDGNRFLDEGEDHFSVTYAKTGAAIGSQPGSKAFQIFDQKTLSLLEPRYRTGTPVIADTFEELGIKLGINGPNFVQTCNDFNAACNAIPSHEFDPLRTDGNSTNSTISPPKSNWALRLDQGPFHAYKVTVGITFTYGGLKTNLEGQAINNENKVMPGLWAVGEIQGGLFYHNYPGGAGLVKGAVFGRIAGIAAAEKAKSDRQSRGRARL